MLQEDGVQTYRALNSKSDKLPINLLSKLAVYNVIIQPARVEVIEDVLRLEDGEVIWSTQRHTGKPNKSASSVATLRTRAERPANRTAWQVRTAIGLLLDEVLA